MDNIVEIVRKHKKEEDAKLKTCYRCGKKYRENKTFSIAKFNLDETSDKPGTVVGYASVPYLSGIKALSGNIQGKELDMCDFCNHSFLIWLDDFKNELQELRSNSNEVIKHD